MVSRAGRRFAELAAASTIPAMTRFDGEVAIFDDTLISRFEWFRKRPEDVAATPPIYMAFDCRYLEGRTSARCRYGSARRTERVLEHDQVLLFPPAPGDGCLEAGPRWSSGGMRAGRQGRGLALPRRSLKLSM